MQKTETQDDKVEHESSDSISWMGSVFTDHTLAHPLTCRGGVVARLSA